MTDKKWTVRKHFSPSSRTNDPPDKNDILEPPDSKGYKKSDSMKASNAQNMTREKKTIVSNNGQNSDKMRHC